MLVLATACFLLLLPGEAAGWGKSAHTQIARLALAELPPDFTDVTLFEDDIMAGASSEDFSPGRRASTSANWGDTANETELLMSIRQGGDGHSRYLSYRLGLLSRDAANAALPLAARPDPQYSMVLGKFEAEIDKEIESFGVRDISFEPKRYPGIFLNHVSTKARMSEGAVRDAYAFGGGYDDLRDDIVRLSLHRAVEAVASIWMTVLSGDFEPAGISAAMRQNYFVDQIRASSTGGNLDDVLMAFETLHSENRRIPLTANIVGSDFFDLPCGKKTKRIFELAAIVDPQSAAVSQKKRECKNYVELNPVIKKKKRPPKRNIPGSLHGRNGEEPDIYVYQHKSGLLLLTSKVKRVGPDYALLNYEPVKKMNNIRIMKRTKSDPQVVEFDLEAIINSYAKDYGVHPAMVKAIIKAESDFDPYVVSHAGARGLMQLMPSTALEMQVDDSFDPAQNIGGGVQYFALMLELFSNDKKLALAAYNAGPGNVLRHGGIPPFKETQRYVPRVLKYYDEYKKDPAPIRLKVALNKKPAVDYLPATEVVEEMQVKEIVSAPSASPEPAREGEVIVRLKNGSTMRGDSYEKIGTRIRLKFKRSWIDIREDLITEII